MVLALLLLDPEDDIPVHLDEAPVAVPREALVLRGLGQREHGLVVQAEVEDRVHHPGHGVARARADGDKEREARGVPEPVAHDGFHVPHACLHLGLERGRVAALVGVEVGADLRRDRETRGDRQSDARHLGQVRALAPEEVLHAAVAVGVARSPCVHVLEGLLGGGFLSRSRGFRARLLGIGFGGHVDGSVFGKKGDMRAAQNADPNGSRWGLSTVELGP